MIASAVQQGGRVRGELGERQCGTALLEFMVVAPFLFLLTIGGAELGRLIQHHETLIKTGRDAARYLASETSGSLGVVVLTTQLKTRAKNLAVYGNIGGTGPPLLPGLTTGDVAVTEPAAQFVQVTVNYTYQPVFDVDIPTFGLGDGPITLSLPMTATTIMHSL